MHCLYKNSRGLPFFIASRLERFFISNKKPLSEVIIQNKNRFLCGASKWRFLSASFKLFLLL